MARSIHTLKQNDQTAASNSIINQSITPHQTHVDFMEVGVHTAKCDSCEKNVDFTEVRVHTAKCDSCEKNNKLTLYRCMECCQHVCSVCWEKSQDGTHVFRGRSRDVPDVNANDVIDDNKGDGEPGHDVGRTRRRRVIRVISDDEDDLPVLKDASTTKNAEATDASKQHHKRNNVMMEDDHYQDHEDNMPSLYPMVPGCGLPVLRHSELIANTSVTESANHVMQRNHHINGEAFHPERQRNVRAYDTLGRPTYLNAYGPPSPNIQAHRPSQATILYQQADRSDPPNSQPVIYRPRPGVDVDRQAARNQLAFAYSQHPNRQAPGQGQPSVARQQAPRDFRPVIYRPRPGADVDRQAARNQLAFPPPQDSHQILRQGQDSVVHHQQAVHPALHPAQDTFFTSRQHAQTIANENQAAARDQQAYEEKAQAYADRNQTADPNRQATSSYQNPRMAASRDQVAAHNQQAFISNQRSSSAATYDQIMAARDQQRAYIPQSRAHCPTCGPARSALYPRVPNSPHLPDQAFVSHQRNAHVNSPRARDIGPQDRLNGPSAGMQVEEHSPEVIEAADALLHYAGVEQDPGDHSRSEQPVNRPVLADSPAARSPGLSALGRQSHPGSRLPMSDHAAMYLDQWDSGRAAQSSRSSISINAPIVQLDRPRSAVSASYPHSNDSVQNTTIWGNEPGQAAEPRVQAQGNPSSMPRAGELNDVDVVMGSPDIKIPEDDGSRHGESFALESIPWTIGQDVKAEKARSSAPEPDIGMYVGTRPQKHQRGEEKTGEREASKEQKASGDVDVVDARGRSGKDKLSEQIDDEADDVKITAWKKVGSNKKTEDQIGANAKADDSNAGRAIKKGVARPKKPESELKVRMGKASATHIG